MIALLSGRSALIYKELFSILSQHAQRLNLTFRPAMVTSDFELALMKTVADEVNSNSCSFDKSHSILQMPNARHIGCNFHFVQSIYRQVQQLQLVTAYGEDEIVRSTVRKLMCLALVPIENVEDAFNEVKNRAPISTKKLIEYFDRYWIAKVKWSLWNVGDVELRTNNIVEGYIVFLYLQMVHRMFRMESPIQSIGIETSSQRVASIRVPQKRRSQCPSTNPQDGNWFEEEQIKATDSS